MTFRKAAPELPSDTRFQQRFTIQQAIDGSSSPRIARRPALPPRSAPRVQLRCGVGKRVRPHRQVQRNTEARISPATRRIHQRKGRPMALDPKPQWLASRSPTNPQHRLRRLSIGPSRTQQQIVMVSNNNPTQLTPKLRARLSQQRPPRRSAESRHRIRPPIPVMHRTRHHHTTSTPTSKRHKLHHVPRRHTETSPRDKRTNREGRGRGLRRCDLLDRGSRALPLPSRNPGRRTNPNRPNRLQRLQRRTKRHIQMHRPRIHSRSQRHSPSSRNAEPPHRVSDRQLRSHRCLTEPAHMTAVQRVLIDGLPSAPAPQLRRPVSSQHHQRHAGIVCLDHRRQVVGRCSARRAHQHHRPP